MMQVILLSKPQINWKDFSDVVQGALGRSPTAMLASKGISFTGDLNQFLSGLIEIQTKGSNPLGDPGILADHLHFVLGVTTTKSMTWDIITHTRLAITSVQAKIPEFNFTVLSGTLTQWRVAIANCNGIESLDLFVHQVTDVFNSIGLKGHSICLLQ